MTRAEIIQQVRYLVNEESTQAGALLDDDGNLIGYLDDAVEQVVLDLVDVYPSELLTHEDVDLKANQKEYELATEFWQILKICKVVSGESETEIEIFDPLSQQYAETNEETTERPIGANIIAGILHVYPAPSADYDKFIRVWGVQAEVVTIGENGPIVLPRPAHRLIVLWACHLIALMIGASKAAQGFMLLYQNRLEKLKKMQTGKFQQAPRFVRESVVERSTRDARDPAYYDKEWI